MIPDPTYLCPQCGAENTALKTCIAELEKRLDFISKLARNWVTEEKWRAKVRILLVYADYNEPLVDHVQLAKDKVNSQPKENEG